MAVHYLEMVSNGTLVGIRKPLAAHEQPVMRTYSRSRTSNKQ